MFFRGFDTDIFPGFDVMQAIKPNFDFVGYYLRAPSHPDQSWVGKRSGLLQLGYGLAPIFVGQEVAGPGSHNVTAEQGERDGVAAAQAMLAEGFKPGSRVYLDLENGPPFGKPEAAYVAAMLRACAAGGIDAGVYVSHAMVTAVLAQNPGVPVWLFKVPTVSRTTASAPFTPPNPALGGLSAAVAWQYRQNVQITVAGHTLIVDMDTANVADPSAPG